MSQVLLESFARSNGFPAELPYRAPDNEKLIHWNERVVQFRDLSYSCCAVYDKGQLTAVVDIPRNFCTCGEQSCSHRRDAVGSAYELIQELSKFDREAWDRGCQDADTE